MPDINGIPYVESTDLVSGWPTISQSVAQEVSDQLASKLDATSQTIIQIVRATDNQGRSTTSTTYVDVTGASVTITPQESDSAILVVANYLGSPFRASGTTQVSMDVRITDSSGNPISGAERAVTGTSGGAVGGDWYFPSLLIAYATPATTSAVTYKLQFKSESASTSARVIGSNMTTEMYAIEVAA